MRLIDWCVETGAAGGSETGTIEVEDDATDEEIQEAVDEVAFNIVSWGWSEREK